jgi:hypothetical protein
MDIKKEVLVIGGFALLAIGSHLKHKSKNNCDQCAEARNFKSQLGKTVESNPTWKKINKYYSENTKILREKALKVVTAKTQAEYADAITYFQNLKGLTGFRYVITQPDGNVYYDSSKTNNALANAKEVAGINVNHNTRAEFMSAQLSCDGRGNAIRLSTSTGNREAYQARRIVNLYGDNFGTLRISQAVAT